MIHFVVGGLNKDSIANSIKQTGGEHVSVTITTDFDAASKIKTGQADYYIGACNSGGGAALSILIGILGYNNCSTVARNGGKPNSEAIKNLVDEGKVAFGTAVESIEEAVPIIVNSILEKHDLS